MRLHSFDDFPFHQHPAPYSLPATTDSKYNDGYWFAFYAADWYFVTVLRLHPNVNTIDGATAVAHGSQQHCVRASRALRPRADDLSVGPLRLEIVEPMRRQRLSLAENPAGIRFDVVFEAQAPPFVEDRYQHFKYGALVSSPVTGWVPKFMSLWNSPKPVIAMVHGWCVGGGSEMALCSDIVLMSEDARIGTPYSRMWGCHHAGMWVYRLGLARAKELALTGRPLSGREAADIGLVNAAYPFSELEKEAYALARRLSSIPSSQLTAMKLIINQAYENMGLKSTQLLGSVLDAALRNTPEALRFIELADDRRAGAVERPGSCRGPRQSRDRPRDNDQRVDRQGVDGPKRRRRRRDA